MKPQRAAESPAAKHRPPVIVKNRQPLAEMINEDPSPLQKDEEELLLLH